MPPPISHQQIQQFQEEGALILEGFYSFQELAPVVSLLDRYVDESATRRRITSSEYEAECETKVQFWPASEEKAAIDLMANARLDEVTRLLIGDYDCRGAAAFGTPYQCGQGWHQDSGSEDPTEFVLNRIVYPRDSSPEQGPLYYVPGSHRRDLPKGGNHDSIPGECQVIPQAGMLAVIHSRCFHRVGINQTQQTRIQINSRANPKGVRPDLCNYAVFRNCTWCHSSNGPWEYMPPPPV